MSEKPQQNDKFTQIYTPIAIKELEIMKEKIERYELALKRIGREGAGFGPAAKIARDAITDL